MKLDLFIEPYTKTNSKQIEDFNICPKTIKFLEENTGGKLFDIGLTNVFLDMSPWETQEAKTNQWNLIKLKSFCTAKKTINKTKRPATESENRFANNVSDKWLISKIYKELIQLNIKKQY